jgi:two-component system NarL family sensor kinase
VGVLTLYASEPEFFKIEEIELLDTLTGNLSFAIEALDQEEKRQQAEAALLESEVRLRYLTSQLLTVQEKERSRLSRELHDGLGQALLVFKLQLRGIERDLPGGRDDLKSDCRHALRFIDEIIEDIRRLSRDLSPSVLEDIGLAAAIRNLCEEFSRLQDVPVSLDMDEVSGVLSKEAQINVYRIFQESLANISKYAGATRVDAPAGAGPHESEG